MDNDNRLLLILVVVTFIALGVAIFCTLAEKQELADPQVIAESTSV